MESFGARLRSRREQKRLALESIATRTKIKMSLLDELERDELRHWPVGLFARAYVKAYAQAIDLDPGEVVREFVALHPESAEAPAADPADDRRLSARLRSLIGSTVPDRLRRRREDEVPLSIVGATAFEPPGAKPVPSVAPSLADTTSGDPGPSLSAIAHVCSRLGHVIDVTE